MGAPGAPEGACRWPAIASSARRGRRAAAHVLWDEPFSADDLRYVRAMKVRVGGGGAAARRRRARREARPGRHPRRRVRRAAAPARARARRRRAPRARHPRRPRRSSAAAATSIPTTPPASPTRTGSCAASSTSLQLEDERQMHTVPADRDQRRRVARVLGFRGTPEAGPTEAFDAELAAHRLRVRARPRAGVVPAAARARCPARARSGEAATAERLAAFGFADVERTRQAVAELTRGLTRSSRMMQQLLPAPPRLAVGLAGSRPRPARAPPAGVGRARSRRRWPPRSGTRRRSRATSPSCWARAASWVTSSSPTPTSSSGFPTPSRLRTSSCGRPRRQRAERASRGGRTATSGSERCSDGSSATCSGVAARDVFGHAGRGAGRRRPHPPGRGHPRVRAPTPSTRRSRSRSSPSVASAAASSATPATSTSPSCTRDADAAEAERVASGRPPLRRRRHPRRAHLGRRRRPPPRGTQRSAGAQPRGLGRATSNGGSRPGSGRRTCAFAHVAGDADLGRRLVDAAPVRRRGSGPSPPTTSARCDA